MDEAGLRPAWRVVSAEALRHNLSVLQRAAGGAPLLAVVQADAYGHGASWVGRALEAEPCVHGLVVAGLDEASALRQASCRADILVLGGALPSSTDVFQICADQGFQPILSSARQVSAACGRLRRVHLLVDTGMSRLGVSLEELESCLAELSGAGVELVGLATHFAESERRSSAVTNEQLERFELAARAVWSRFPAARLHVANSAAALHLHAEGASWRDAVPELARAVSDPERTFARPGGALYGVDLSEFEAGTERPAHDLRPVLGVACRVTQVREIPAGARVGYGGTWTAPRPSRIGLLPVGYADGVPGHLDRGAAVRVAGRRAPIVGAISMDLTTVDLTDLPEVHEDALVWLLGGGGEREGGLSDWVLWSGRKPYEILCGWSRRLALRQDRPAEPPRGGEDA